MKLQVSLKKVQELVCEIEVENFDQAKTAIEALLPDDFSEIGEYNELAVIDEQGDNVEGKIQPYTPNL